MNLTLFDVDSFETMESVAGAGDPDDVLVPYVPHALRRAMEPPQPGQARAPPWFQGLKVQPHPAEVVEARALAHVEEWTAQC